MKISRAVVSIMVCVACVLAASACSRAVNSTDFAGNPIAQRETLTQVSTINALLAGVYDGVISCGELKSYGDFGIGTFEAVDGEMVELDGKVYQVKSDGVAYAADDSLKVPFAEVTFFNSDRQEQLVQGSDLARLEAMLDAAIPANVFCAIKISGTFSYARTRSVPKQVKPYPPLTQVTQNQSVFEFNNVSGTIVGFRCPQYINGVNVPGYHLHFLTQDRKAGGHVLDLTVDMATAALDYTPQFFLKLPPPESDFYKIDLSANQESSIQTVEK